MYTSRCNLFVSFFPPQIFSQANTPLKRWLLNFAAKRKGAEVSAGVIRSDSFWDKVFFSKIQVGDHTQHHMYSAHTCPSLRGLDKLQTFGPRLEF